MKGIILAGVLVFACLAASAAAPEQQALRRSLQQAAPSYTSCNLQACVAADEKMSLTSAQWTQLNNLVAATKDRLAAATQPPPIRPRTPATVGQPPYQEYFQTALGINACRDLLITNSDVTKPRLIIFLTDGITATEVAGIKSQAKSAKDMGIAVAVLAFKKTTAQTDASLNPSNGLTLSASSPAFYFITRLSSDTSAGFVAVDALVAPNCNCRRTCAEAKAVIGTTTDQELGLCVGLEGYRASIYCADMATTTPLEYLTLPSSDGSYADRTYNYAAYGVSTSDTRIFPRSYFKKVRFNVAKMRVTPDWRFANYTAGAVAPAAGVKLAWGTTGACHVDGVATGSANINLVGTQFAVCRQAYTALSFGSADITLAAVGSGATYSNNNQVVSIAAGGQCGYYAPGQPLTTGAAPPLQLTWAHTTA